MKLRVPKGHYIVAVSGGVDSMVLLDVLRQLPEVQLTVAHFDHGIRPDSGQDLALVRSVAEVHGLPFVFDQAHLGPKVNEAKARQVRYDFLHTVCQASGASAIITAHHKDDLLETAIINLLRGTSRRGLSSLKTHDKIIRPLLGSDKADLIRYAKKNKLQWREDSTNKDEKYLRNYVRLQILSKFTDSQKKQLEKHIQVAGQLNQGLETLLISQLHMQPAPNKIDRNWFTHLPHAVAKEVLASWLRMHNVGFDRKIIERLVVAAKTYQPHKQIDISRGYRMKVSRDYLALTQPDR